MSQERKLELKDVLFVWTKMHLVHCQQSQQDWQMFHENMTGTMCVGERGMVPPARQGVLSSRAFAF